MMRRVVSWRVLAVCVVGVALSVAGIGPFGGIDAASAAVTPGVFTANLDCTTPMKVVGVGNVTVTAPDDATTVPAGKLWVRIGTDAFVEGAKVMTDSTLPSVAFTYSHTFGADPYLGLLDLRLTTAAGNPNGPTPTGVLASVNDVVVRAAQGCDEPDVTVTLSAASRACTAPTILTGTLDITGDNTPAELGTVGLDFYNGAARVVAVLATVDADTRSWTVNFGPFDLASTLTYEVTSSVPTIRRLAAGTTAVPSCLGIRLFGTDAVDTAIDISQEAFAADGAAAVVLARSDFFSDALAGGPLAAEVGGPMLITPGASQSAVLLPKVLAEINRVLEAGDTVYVLGGPLALSSAIDDQLEDAGYVVERISGNTLFGTAVAIANEITGGGAPNQIFEATGLSFADALSAVPAAIKNGGVILLTNGNQQAPETAAYINAHPGVARYAIGGPLAAAGADPGAVAIYGDTLYDTSAQVATVFFPNPTVIGIATGNDYPDALGGGVFMATQGRSGPVLLVNQNVPLPTSIATYIDTRLHVAVAWVFGGPLAIDPAVVNAVISLLTS